MYLSLEKIFNKYKLTPQELLLLQAIHQQKGSDIEDFVAMLMDDSALDRFIENEWVNQIKGTKKDSEISKLRTTKKGVKILQDLQKDEEYEEQDEILGNWVEKVYSKRVNYVKSNKKELFRRLHWFRFETGIHENHLAVLLTLLIVM